MGYRTLARLHGWFNLVNGLWPLLHMRSFVAVSGPKTDLWLVRTVAGLMVTNGITQLGAASSAATVPSARQIGIGTAATLLGIELRYATVGRISRIYLLDSAVEALWIVLWLRQRRRRI